MTQALAFPSPVAAAAVKNKWMIALAVSMGALLEVVDTSIVNVAMTDIQASLGATLSEVSWVVSSYAVANVIILPMTAWLGHRFGKKWYFVFSLIAFILSSIACGMATSLATLVIARVIQGLGGGGLLAKAQSILFETFPPSEQAMAQGFFGVVVVAGPAIGPTLGGYLTTNFNWRWIFFINIPIGIAAVFMCLTFLPEDEKRDKSIPLPPIDWLGIGLLTAGLGALQTVLEEGQTDDWFSSAFIWTFSWIAGVSLVLFVWRELTAKAPVVDLRMLRYRSLWAGSILSVVVGMALYGALFAVPIFAQSLMHYTAQQTGMLLLPGALTSAVAFPLAARLISKVDPRVMLAGGAMVLASAVIALGRLSPQTGASDLFWPLVVRAFGTVLMFLPLSLATLGPIPKKDMAGASGFFNLTRQLGGSIGVALLTTLLARRNVWHHTVLIEKLDPSNLALDSRLAGMIAGLQARGIDLATAKQTALRMLDGMVNMQAAVLSFGDTFRATAVLIFATLPLIFLLGKPTSKMDVSGGH
ncbi:MAG TPA: DHA2 family efflux MFS transporter permease subunit [Polyangiaceae bacterium]|nr:DHA2 family efflux MFS transporter permease subunit [Polyangiaceae bacterium]